MSKDPLRLVMAWCGCIEHFTNGHQIVNKTRRDKKWSDGLGNVRGIPMTSQGFVVCPWGVSDSQPGRDVFYQLKMRFP